MAKQKVVIKVPMEDAKKRSKALKIVVGLPGVLSAGLEGESKDKIVVVGEGVDSITLTTLLRKKMGYVELVSVAAVDEKKGGGKDKKENTSDGSKNVAQPVWPYAYPYVSAPPPPPPYGYEVRENYDPCSIM